MRKTLLVNQQHLSSKDTGKTTKTGKPNKGKFLILEIFEILIGFLWANSDFCWNSLILMNREML